MEYDQRTRLQTLMVWCSLFYLKNHPCFFVQMESVHSSILSNTAWFYPQKSKSRSFCAYLYFLSPVWVRTCCWRWLSWTKLFWHLSHLQELLSRCLPNFTQLKVPNFNPTENFHPHLNKLSPQSHFSTLYKNLLVSIPEIYITPSKGHLQCSEAPSTLEGPHNNIGPSGPGI